MTERHRSDPALVARACDLPPIGLEILPDRCGPLGDFNGLPIT